MVGHGGSSAGSYLADPTSPIPSHCASNAMISTLRAKREQGRCMFHLKISAKSVFFGYGSTPPKNVHLRHVTETMNLYIQNILEVSPRVRVGV